MNTFNERKTMNTFNDRQLGYTRSDEIRLLRRKHKIGFRIGITARDLARLITNIPDSATVDEVIDEDGLITIEFHHEVKEEA